jgi:hypothetical protein
MAPEAHMRVVRIEVGFNTYLWSVSGHEMNKISSDLPPDARVLSVAIDHDRRVVLLIVESSAFADVPDWQPTLTIETTELLMLADLVSRRHVDFENGLCPRCGDDLAGHPCPH